jgi:NAD(P)-dependent dehydrogenase (short-subunit alcohol dehydrogenase family)
MKRTNVVTGSASGIGLATKEKLETLGHKVIGIDIHDADIVADLSGHEGRKSAADKALALSFVASSLFSLLVYMVKRSSFNRVVPFAPFMLIGLLFVQFGAII